MWGEKLSKKGGWGYEEVNTGRDGSLRRDWVEIGG